jgi:hypothetical protein
MLGISTFRDHFREIELTQRGWRVSFPTLLLLHRSTSAQSSSVFA